MGDFNMPFCFGPVPSRRLGSSLGIDLLPNKTCNYSCIYCQLGRTSIFTNTRCSFFSKEEIWQEIQEKIKNTNKSSIDYITIVGNGEPTLSLDLGWIIHQLKQNYSFPVAVITNGALLYESDVRSDLTEADIVLPTYDSGFEKTFRSINRPHKEITLEKVTQGLIDFHNEFSGEIWIEIMLVADYNDSRDELEKIFYDIQEFRPDKIYINVPIRPPAEKWVSIPSLEALTTAQKIFPDAKIISFAEMGEITVNGQDIQEIHKSLIDVIRRHPLRKEQLFEILRNKKIDPEKVFETLISLGHLKLTKYQNQLYIQHEK